MRVDKRLLRIVCDHAQRRVSQQRVGVVCRGIDFLEGELTNMWVNPITGVLQSRPNSEDPEYVTSGSGLNAKIGLSDVTVTDGNGHSEYLVTMAVGHTGDALRYTGANTDRVSVLTNTSYPGNTGVNITQYAYGNSNDAGDILVEFGWNSSPTGTAGESVRVYLDGRIEIYRNDAIYARGSFGGGAYQFGTVKGGSYVKPSDQFVQIRAEIRSPYLILTSSMGGIFQFACPWAIDQYNTDGSVSVAASDVTSENKLWWSVPKGGVTIVWSPVRYPTTGNAVSAEFALSEIPGGSRTFASRPIPEDSGVTISLTDPTGTGSFDVDTNRCRVKAEYSSTTPVWIDCASARYEPKTLMTTTEETDLTPWLRDVDMALEDGPEGLVLSFELGGDCPVPGLTEVENRPIRCELIAHPDDPETPPTTVLLDGVASPPEWSDGLIEENTSVRLEVHDRLSLGKDLQATELILFDGSYLCRSTGAGDSAVQVALNNIGFDDSELELPDLDFVIEHVPPQKVDDYAFAVKAGDKWFDVLTKLFDLAPQLVWGVKPTASGPKFFVLDPDDATIEATLYRTPESAELDPDYEDDDAHLGGFPLLYGDHHRNKLPLEANLVRVLGLDPASGKPLTASRSDDNSRDPQGTKNGTWLGSTRTVAFQSGGLTTQPNVDKVADALASAVSQRSYVEPWRSFMLFKDDFSPLWRGDKVVLKTGLPSGGDSTVHISSFRPDIVDESGGGLMDLSGTLAPVSIRLCNYTGGALCGLGGSGEYSIVARQRKKIEQGGWHSNEARRIPQISPQSSTIS